LAADGSFRSCWSGGHIIELYFCHTLDSWLLVLLFVYSQILQALKRRADNRVFTFVTFLKVCQAPILHESVLIDFVWIELLLLLRSRSRSSADTLHLLLGKKTVR